MMASLDRLSSALSKLPGIGRRSAERMALRLVLDRKQMLAELIAALDEAERELCCCSLCGSVTSTDSDPCRLCTSLHRDDDVLCVVETPNDIMMIERSGGFHGRYHALMGKLSPMKGDGISDLRFDVLRERMANHKFREIILALSTDVEGDSTAAYIAESLRDSGIKISRLASGLPTGSGIMYSDSLTLSRALDGRTEL
jgi:recombination protein RecR